MKLECFLIGWVSTRHYIEPVNAIIGVSKKCILNRYDEVVIIPVYRYADQY